MPGKHVAPAPARPLRRSSLWLAVAVVAVATVPLAAAVAQQY